MFSSALSPASHFEMETAAGKLKLLRLLGACSVAHHVRLASKTAPLRECSLAGIPPFGTGPSKPSRLARIDPVVWKPGVSKVQIALHEPFRL
jgi:hypothetical protein